MSGFLTDYSRLEPISNTSFRYINPKYNLGDYAKFIIEPVEIYFDDKAKAAVMGWDELEKLKSYMRRTLIDTLEPRYNAVGTRIRHGTAIVRIALTNVERAKPFKMGSVSMEMELLDSVTDQQIAALIESRKKEVSFLGLDPWSGAKAVMDDWAQRFYNRLEEAR